MASLLAAAVVISRGNVETLDKTLSDLSNQTHPLQQVVVVEGAGSQECVQLAKSFGFGVVEAPGLELGAQLSAGVKALSGNSTWVWILHHDTAPEKEALQYLAQAAEISPSVAIIGPKQLDWDHPIQIKQLGLTTTRTSRPFTLVEDEFDQGQFDAKGDTMAVSTAGMLVSLGVWQQIGGLNPHTPAYAQDIEFCIKARAMGYRVVVEPKARILSKGSLTSELVPRRRLFGGRAEALSKAHVHLATILWPGPLLPILYLAMPLVVALSIPVNLLQKRPSRILGQLAAWLFSWFTIPTRMAARRQVRSLGPLSSLQKLFATTEQVSLRRSRRFEEEPEPEVRPKGFIESGGLWISLLPLVASYLAFPQGALSREGLRPLGRSLEGVWDQVAASSQSYLDGVLLPSDPYNWFLALLASIWPASPSAALAWFVFISPTLLFTGVWYLAGLLTKNHFLKSAAALLTSTALPFVLLQREAGVTELTAIVFATFSAFFLAKSAFAFNLARSWRWLGVAGLAGAAVAVSSPLLFASLGVLSMGLGLARMRRIWVLSWFSLPGLVLLWPWIEFALQSGRFEFLSVSSAATLPVFDPYEDFLWFITIAITFGFGLVSAAYVPRFGLPALAFALGLVFLSSLQPIAGSRALVFAALVVLILIVVAAIEKLGPRSSIAAVTSMGFLGVASFGFAIQQPLNFDFVQERQVPALVMAASDVDWATRTLNISGTDQGFAAEIIWGDGRNQEETSLLYPYLRPQSPIETKLAQLSAALVAGNPAGVQELIRQLGIDFVLIDSQLNPKVQIALDSMTELQSSGETSFGLLWRVVEPNSSPIYQTLHFASRDLQLAAIAAFVLLAIPTPGSITGRRLRRSA